jgi:hypothetical protein
MSDFRKATDVEWASRPFTIHEVGGTKYLVFPSKAKEPLDITVNMGFGILAWLAKTAGYEIVPATRGDRDDAAFATVSTMLDSITGAYQFLRRGKRVVEKNIPSGMKVGWNFAQWVQLAHLTGHKDGHHFLVFKKPDSIRPKAWDTNGGQHYCDQVTDLIRKASIALAKWESMDRLERYIHTEGWFVQTMKGTDPEQGLYHEEERQLLINNEKEKIARIRQLHQSMCKVQNEYLQIAGFADIDKYFKEFYIEKSKICKEIVSTKMYRQSHLIVTIKRGRTITKSLAKGATLTEKIITNEYCKPVRDIPSILWSPLTQISREHFVSVCQAANIRNHPDPPTSEGLNQLLASHGYPMDAATSVDYTKSLILSVLALVNAALLAGGSDEPEFRAFWLGASD